MKRFYLVASALLLCHAAYADQLDGLEDLGTIVTVISIAIVHLFILFFSGVIRFSEKEYKVSIPLNFASFILILCSLIALSTLGSSIDPGFRLTCIGIILLAGTAILLNYRVGRQHKSEK